MGRGSQGADERTAGRRQRARAAASRWSPSAHPTLEEVDRIIADLYAAGLVAVGRDGEGRARWELTASGRRLADIASTWGPDGPAGHVGLMLGAVTEAHKEARRI